jgi:poly(3-hydroxybutyrate) depolymerase
MMLTNACRRVSSQFEPVDGRLTARTRSSVKTTAMGRIDLAIGDRGAILQVPAKTGDSTVPLLVFLHGAGQSAAEMMEYLGSVPEEAGVAVLAPNSSDFTGTRSTAPLDQM